MIVMMQNIIYEDDDLIVVHKPEDIATQTARLGQKDMVSQLKNYLAEKSANKGEPYIGVIHRLDQPVEGLLLFAKNKETAANLSRQITDNTIQKYYYALVLGTPEQQQGELRDYLLQDMRGNQSKVVAAGTKDAKEACLQYQVMGQQEEISLIKVKLKTGRHHQIRVQMSHAGMPLIGDNKYGNEKSKEKSRQMNCQHIALCACLLEFIHPRTKEKKTFEIQPLNQVFSPFFSS